MRKFRTQKIETTMKKRLSQALAEASNTKNKDNDKNGSSQTVRAQILVRVPSKYWNQTSRTVTIKMMITRIRKLLYAMCANQPFLSLSLP